MKTRVIKNFAFCLLALAYSGCNNKSESNKEENVGKKVVLKLEPGPNNLRNSEGDFISLKDGRIFFIYSHFTGTSSSDSAPAYLAGRVSSDGGKTWASEESKIVKREGKINSMSVSLLRLQNGQIALFYLRKNSESNCIPMMRISTDEAETWSDPIQCINDRKEYFVMNNDRVVQLKNGRLLMPVSLHKTPGGVWGPSSGKGNIYTYFSDDNGLTWKSSEKAANPESVRLQEPGVVELKNGDIFMFMRTTEGVQYISFSEDKGETWSAVEPSNIKSPCSPASIERIPSTGDLLMVWNNNGKDQKRTPLNIAVSKDEGKTWEKIKTIGDEPNGWYCYTAIHFIGRHVLLGHCAGYKPEEGRGRSVTHITKLDLDWIYK
jgi:Neuraminidase (sialidase)